MILSKLSGLAYLAVLGLGYGLLRLLQDEAVPQSIRSHLPFVSSPEED
jgi:hypothetical protein